MPLEDDQVSLLSRLTIVGQQRANELKKKILKLEKIDRTKRRVITCEAYLLYFNERTKYLKQKRVKWIVACLSHLDKLTE